MFPLRVTHAGLNRDVTGAVPHDKPEGAHPAGPSTYSSGRMVDKMTAGGSVYGSIGEWLSYTSKHGRGARMVDKMTAGGSMYGSIGEWLSYTY